MKNNWFTWIMFLCLLGAILPAYGKEKPTLGSLGEGVLCTDDFPARPARAAAMQDQQAAALPMAPLEDTFLLHSYPSSDQKLYLDFDGFDGVWGDYTAWTMDGDAGTFNDTERTVIQQTWQSVSEDFLPFAVDVTTEDPGGSWLGQRAVIDGSHQYTYSWAYYGDWASTADREAYIYPGDDTWLWIADSISHEVGHTLNLGHDGNPSDGTYYLGHGTGDTQWCPIMGWGAWSLNQWDDGEYFGTTNPNQDDLATIDAVTGVDFRPDDHSSTIGTATAIALPPALSFVADGIIGHRTDIDYFAFTTSGGNVQFSINEDVVIGASNLDILAKIHDAGGAVLYTSNPVDKIYASFDVTLDAGNYYLSIDGTGMGNPGANPPTGYSDYGCLGYYSIEAMGDASASCAYTCGDIDGSGGNVDLVDYGLFANCWGENPLINLSCACANLVEYDDHEINLLDLYVFAELFLTSSEDYPPNCSTSITDPYAPTPDPMNFATAPYATGTSSIAMVATTATDVSDVEYYFTCTAAGGAGGNNSGWQDGTSYEDTGLDPDTSYTYTVTARDKSVNQNATAPSAALSATTDPPVVADTVTITKAEWNDDPSKLELKVEATSSDQPSVTLTLVGYGTMTWDGNNKYRYTEKPTTNPGTVTVTSSGGGSAVKTVTVK